MQPLAHRGTPLACERNALSQRDDGRACAVPARETADASVVPPHELRLRTQLHSRKEPKVVPRICPETGVIAGQSRRQGDHLALGGVEIEPELVQEKSEVAPGFPACRQEVARGSDH